MKTVLRFILIIAATALLIVPNFVYFLITTYLGGLSIFFCCSVMVLSNKNWSKAFIRLFIVMDDKDNENIDIVNVKKYSKNSWESKNISK